MNDDMIGQLAEALHPGERAPVGAVERLQVIEAGELVADLGFGGDGTPAFPFLCAAKPVAAAALLRLTHEPTGVSLQDPVARYVPELDVDGKRDIRLHDLLTHRTGITREPIPRGWDDARILSWIASSPVHEEAKQAPNYGMFTSWHLIGLVLSRVTGTERVAAMRRLVLDPLGLDIGFGATETATPPTPVLDVRTDQPRPLAWITDPRVLAAAWTGVGMWGTVAQLARFYSAFLVPDDAVPDPLAAALRDLTETIGTGIRSWDADGGDWGYSAGAYTGTSWIGRGFAFSAVGLDAATGTVGFVDPVNRVVFAYGTNLMRLAAPVMLRRRRLVQAAYRACGLVAFPRR
jgi:CubicO group peptidase (beta-lactamase class C family)